MKTERRNTFETNSSSTHSMIILTEEENEKINSGELFLKNKYNDDIITKEEADKILMEAIVEYNLQYPEDKITPRTPFAFVIATAFAPSLCPIKKIFSESTQVIFFNSLIA
jgi:hypothetical protein